MPVHGSRSIDTSRFSPASTASLPIAAKATRDGAGSDLAGERDRRSFERPTASLGPQWSLRLNVAYWQILLQKSEIARRQFSCCKKIRPTTADRCGLNHVTGVASEFFFGQ